MRENRTYGSEGGVARAIPTPIYSKQHQVATWVYIFSASDNGRGEEQGI